ncbi:MAG TPA: hypothetical protein VLL95_06380, partial [Phnomibacter sp.]|nr:hypothetical protein [Phnomibacter sp.]
STSKKSLKNGLNNEPDVFAMFAMLPPFFGGRKLLKQRGNLHDKSHEFPMCRGRKSPKLCTIFFAVKAGCI